MEKHTSGVATEDYQKCSQVEWGFFERQLRVTPKHSPPPLWKPLVGNKLSALFLLAIREASGFIENINFTSPWSRSKLKHLLRQVNSEGRNTDCTIKYKQIRRCITFQMWTGDKRCPTWCCSSRGWLSAWLSGTEMDDRLWKGRRRLWGVLHCPCQVSDVNSYPHSEQGLRRKDLPMITAHTQTLNFTDTYSPHFCTPSIYHVHFYTYFSSFLNMDNFPP